MVASFDVFCDIGGSNDTPGTEENIHVTRDGTLRHRTDDFNTIDLENPIPIPTAGSKYGYWKSIYLFCTIAPSTKVDNIVFYTDGGIGWTDCTLWVGDETPTKNSGSDAGYAVATGTPGDTGNEMVANHPDITARTDGETYTSGSPFTVSISETGNSIDSIGETSDYVVLQLEVRPSAVPGALTAETLTFQYDEV